MYGNFGWSWDVDIEKGKSVDNSLKQKFGDNGKMLRYKSVEDMTYKQPIAPQNTTISALLILRELNNRTALIVYENLYAKNPLPREILCGDFDIRFGFDGSVIKKIYTGRGILDEKNLDIDEDNKFFINVV